eukprot:3729414-Rhodomonas_salina.1
MAQNLALMEVRLVVASLVQHFDLHLVSEVIPYHEVTLVPKNTFLSARHRPLEPDAPAVEQN